MALTIMLAVWLVHARGLFRCADDYLADLTGARRAISDQANDVLLVYTDREVFNSDDDRLVELITAINQFQPSQIGIACAISDAQQQRLLDVEVAGELVVGGTLAKLTHSDREHRGQLPSGFLDLDLRGQPIYRWHQVRSFDGHEILESLEARFARANWRRGQNSVRRIRDTFPRRRRGAAACRRSSMFGKNRRFGIGSRSSCLDRPLRRRRAWHRDADHVRRGSHEPA